MRKPRGSEMGGVSSPPLTLVVDKLGNPVLE